VYRHHKDELDAIIDTKERFNKFVEVNVREQDSDLAKTSIVQAA
jgi:carbonic anhydrase